MNTRDESISGFNFIGVPFRTFDRPPVFSHYVPSGHKNVLNTIPREPDTKETRFAFDENTIFLRKCCETRKKHENIFFLQKSANPFVDTGARYGVRAGSKAPRRFFHASQESPNLHLNFIKRPLSRVLNSRRWSVDFGLSLSASASLPDVSSHPFGYFVPRNNPAARTFTTIEKNLVWRDSQLFPVIRGYSHFQFWIQNIGLLSSAQAKTRRTR